MTASDTQRVAEGCREGLEALDRVLEHKPDHVHDTIANATRCIVRLRDALIEAQRAGLRDNDDPLRQVNSLLSVLVASEFPLVGVRWDRLKQARDQYASVTGRFL